MSTGWINMVAVHPERPPMTKGEMVVQREGLALAATGFGVEEGVWDI